MMTDTMLADICDHAVYLADGHACGLGDWAAYAYTAALQHVLPWEDARIGMQAFWLAYDGRLSEIESETAK